MSGGDIEELRSAFQGRKKGPVRSGQPGLRAQIQYFLDEGGTPMFVEMGRNFIEQ